MNSNQLKDLVEKVLIGIGSYNEHAVNLVLGTIAQESGMGKYIKQISGPALGICQMEPNTFEDCLNNFLEYNPILKAKIKGTCNIQELRSESLVYNLAFAIAMCRVHYLRVPEKLPEDLNGYAYYWKKYYNTNLGKGTEQEFINNYKKYVL